MIRRALAIGLLVAMTGACGSAVGHDSAEPTTIVPLSPAPGATNALLPSGPLMEPVRVRVIPSLIELSSDRRTINVTSGYPLNGNCNKIADGVEVVTNANVAELSVWMRTELRAGMVCTMECMQVTQSVTLDEPLPLAMTFVSPSDAFKGCGATSDAPTIVTGA